MTRYQTLLACLLSASLTPGVAFAQSIWTTAGGIATTDDRIDICATTAAKCTLRTGTIGNQFVINNQTTGPTRVYFGTALELKEGSGGNLGMLLTADGKVAIGKSAPQFELDVLGTIRADEVRVNQEGADFVFEDDYDLMTLPEVEEAIRANRHLPGIPSAKEMSEHGVDVAVMQNQLLQKVEELTLYLIQLQKENRALAARVDAMTAEK